MELQIEGHRTFGNQCVDALNGEGAAMPLATYMDTGAEASTSPETKTWAPPPSVPQEIGQAATPVRRRGATECPATSQAAPSVAETAATERKRRGKGARCGSDTIETTPPSQPHGPSDGAGGEGQSSGGSHATDALAATVARIVELQKVRKFCIVSQSRCDRSIESLIATMIGYNNDLDEKDRKALFRRAGEIRRVVEGGEGQNFCDNQELSALSAILPLIPASAQSRAVWDQHRDSAEKEMERLAKTLPIWQWAKAVRGLGPKGVAILVGEAGIPIGDYRTQYGLWKRFGLAVINGERQQRKSGAIDAAMHGYSPGRRAQVWSICSDSLFRAQWRGEKDGIPAHPIGPYGEAYARRRAHTGPRIEATKDLPPAERWTKGRCHNDARRVMTKLLIEDMWKAWRREATT